MAITKHTRHDHCEVQIRSGCGPHHSQLYCTRHGVHVQWLDKHAVTMLQGFVDAKQPNANKGTAHGKLRSKL